MKAARAVTRARRHAQMHAATVAALLVASMLVVAAFNVLVFDDYLSRQGDRYGFRPGQSNEMSVRLDASGNPRLDKEWRVHERLSDLADGRPVHVPPGTPFQDDLLTYFGHIDVVPLSHTPTISVAKAKRLISLIPEYEVLADEEPTWMVFVPDPKGRRSAGPVHVLRLDGRWPGEPSVRWVVASSSALALLEST